MSLLKNNRNAQIKQLHELHQAGHISTEMYNHATGRGNSAPRIAAAGRGGMQVDMIPTAANKGLQRQVFRISCANATGAAITYYFFDQCNYRTVSGLSSTKANGGNFGAASNDVLVALAVGKPCKLQEIVFQSATGTSVAGSALQLFQTGWANTTQIQLNYSPTQEQLNSNVYQFKEIGKVIDAGTSGFVTVQPADTVTLYFHVDIATDAYLMK